CSSDLRPSASMETMKLVQKVSDATGNVFLLLPLMETSTTVSVYALQIIVTTALRSANAGTAYASEKAPASSVTNTSNETTFLICAPSSIQITPVLPDCLRSPTSVPVWQRRGRPGAPPCPNRPQAFT